MKYKFQGSEITQLDMVNWNFFGENSDLRWGDQCSEEEFSLASTSEDEQGDLAKMPNEHALMVVEFNENMKAILVDHCATSFDEEVANMLIEEHTSFVI